MLKRILIVDDSESVRDVMRMFLKDVATVEICGEASDGLEAVQKSKRLKPDLVVLDLALPSMNGVEVASVLKRAMPKMPIIVFTMYSERPGEALRSAIGVDAVLEKPNGMGQLIPSISKLLATKTGQPDA